MPTPIVVVIYRRPKRGLIGVREFLSRQKVLDQFSDRED